MFDRIIQFSLTHRLLVLFAYFILTLRRLYVTGTLPVDVFPEFAPPQVVIQTQAPGMSPQDVEALITFPIETAINDNIRTSKMSGPPRRWASPRW